MRQLNIEASLFDIKFPEPQNFSKYRQLELDAAQLALYSQLSNVKHISKRFAMKRWLGMTDEEILENERMVMEERNKPTKEDENAGMDSFGGGGGMGSGGDDIGLESVGINSPPEDVGEDIAPAAEPSE